MSAANARVSDPVEVARETIQHVLDHGLVGQLRYHDFAAAQDALAVLATIARERGA